jgi:hypothetical protein
MLTTKAHLLEAKALIELDEKEEAMDLLERCTLLRGNTKPI